MNDTLQTFIQEQREFHKKQETSGTKLDEIGVVPTSLSKEPHNEEVGEEVEVIGGEEENATRGEEEPSKIKEPKRKNPLEEPMPIPFPTLAKKAKKHEDLDPYMVEIFKNKEVTSPLFQAIQQVPKYAKFLKDVCTHNDPGPSLVTCVIGGIEFMDCMCDLGACVSIMPLPIYEKLRLSPLKRSGARFVLADKSIVSVVGIAENVLVNIQGLLFPVDFHILETPPIGSDKLSSILLGKPFLKTSRFKLDAHSGAYSFEADGKVVKFTLDGSKKPTLEVYSIFGCDLIDHQMIEPSEEGSDAKELEIFLHGEVPK
ncbi:uncharacterized protein LOC107609659 [Arachis ipaensis]|uniref:uncharacterized protein LOC107609659 n=1 Tax=Arachis ipaensis TaxID=130454 RepID=UPI0007AF68BF|nr:uncharacterized protein LOC107609659 [Arachis ipaensis]XP_025628448.1 uncharacterized protein LOC112721616 [Arachis hypogaea]